MEAAFLDPCIRARARRRVGAEEAAWQHIPADCGRIKSSEPAMKTAKEEVRDLLEQLPESATLEEIQYHIYVRQKIQRGLDAESEGRVISQAEVERRMARWAGK